MSLSQIEEKYGPSLRVIANENARKFAILRIQDDMMKLSPTTFSILEKIAKYRSDGITQLELAKEISMDPRNIFHHIRTLLKLRLM